MVLHLCSSDWIIASSTCLQVRQSCPSDNGSFGNGQSHSHPSSSSPSGDPGSSAPVFVHPAHPVHPAPGSASASGSALPTPYKSAFSSELGLSEAGIAKTNRSKCWKCTKNIAQKEPRFSYYYSYIRPPAWVHAGCLAPLVRQNDLQLSTVQKLRKFKEDSSLDHSLAEACDAIIAELTVIGWVALLQNTLFCVFSKFEIPIPTFTLHYTTQQDCKNTFIFLVGW